MDRIKIVVDTASDISLQEAERYNIALLPVNITVDGKSYREEYDITKEEYWEILENSEILPTTSQVTPQEFLNTYKKFYEEGFNKFVVVTMSSKGSGTFNNANLAYNMFKEEIDDENIEFKIIDSGIYSYCFGRPVLEAGEMLEAGCGFEEICKYLEEKIPKMSGFAYMSTLKYAKASGRISILSAIMGEALGLKPILKVYNGAVDVFAKVRGEKAAISSLISNVKEEIDDVENAEIILVHGNNDPEIINKVKDEINDKLKPKSIFVGKLGCAITNNAGPQTIGILYKKK